MKVICINDRGIDPRIPNRPAKDEVYTIRATVHNFAVGGRKGYLLEEVVNPKLYHPSGLGQFEPNFSVDRFAPFVGEDGLGLEVEEEVFEEA